MSSLALAEVTLHWFHQINCRRPVGGQPLTGHKLPVQRNSTWRRMAASFVVEATDLPSGAAPTAAQSLQPAAAVTPTAQGKPATSVQQPAPPAAAAAGCAAAAAAAAAALALLPAAAASAAEVAAAAAPAEAEDLASAAAAAAAAANGMDPVTNGVVSVVFVAATIGLAIVTVGVIYLAASDWLEKRNLEKLVAEEEAIARKIEAKEEASLKKTPIVRATPKGFGKKGIKEAVVDVEDV